MDTNQYTAAEHDFIFEWAERWCKFFDLIYDLLRTDKPKVPAIPTEIDEINYQCIRSWFIDNKVPFSVLWKDFYEAQDWVLDASDDLITEIRGAEETLEPLFYGFYDFKDLTTLLRVCRVDSKNGKMSE